VHRQPLYVRRQSLCHIKGKRHTACNFSTQPVPFPQMLVGRINSSSVMIYATHNRIAMVLY